jgi:hypothetical protein
MYEGEGCIEKTSSNGFRLSIASTDLDVLERIQTLVGGSIRPLKRYQRHHKQAWKWRLGKKKDVTNFLSQIIPFLGNRRAYDALNALDTMEI